MQLAMSENSWKLPLFPLDPAYQFLTVVPFGKFQIRSIALIKHHQFAYLRIMNCCLLIQTQSVFVFGLQAVEEKNLLLSGTFCNIHWSVYLARTFPVQSPRLTWLRIYGCWCIPAKHLPTSIQTYKLFMQIFILQFILDKNLKIEHKSVGCIHVLAIKHGIQGHF